MKLKDLPDDLKNLAIKRIREQVEDEDFNPDMGETLGESFEWGKTKEGIVFWQTINNKGCTSVTN